MDLAFVPPPLAGGGGSSVTGVVTRETEGVPRTTDPSVVSQHRADATEQRSALFSPARRGDTVKEHRPGRCSFSLEKSRPGARVARERRKPVRCYL